MISRLLPKSNEVEPLGMTFRYQHYFESSQVILPDKQDWQIEKFTGDLD